MINWVRTFFKKKLYIKCRFDFAQRPISSRHHRNNLPNPSRIPRRKLLLFHLPGPV